MEIFYEKEKPTPPYVRVTASSLKRLVKEMFTALSVRESDAEIVADVLVTADLMGISSHGVQRVERYVAGIERGAVNVNAEMRFVVDANAVLVLDADNGLGQVAALKAMQRAIERARGFGVGVVLVKRSHHFGIAGYYALRAVKHGMIGVAMTNSEALVAYIGTVERYLGTNPVAFASPRRQPPPLLYDGALSVVPVGKLEVYSKVGKEVPEGWVISSSGEVMRGDAKRVYEAIRRREAAILPLGGYLEDFGGHKGSGLALIVDVICGVLSGAAWGYHVGYTTVRDANVGHALIALDISKFMRLEEFYERLEQMISEIKSLKKSPWADNIWIPGEKAWLTMQTRLKIGIPIHLNILENLREIARRVGVKFDIEIVEEHTTT
ncbi:MAG: Ldh family oxidoreductase [Desulfurococcaceae archaeon]|nr:Ldh family oxidoreductase [Desulfurococcaceae archaeon]